MGSPADYTLIVMVAVLGAAIWTLLDRVGQLQRDVEELRRKAGIVDTPPDAPP